MGGEKAQPLVRRMALNHLFLSTCRSMRGLTDQRWKMRLNSGGGGENGLKASAPCPPLTLFYICPAAFFLHANCTVQPLGSADKPRVTPRRHAVLLPQVLFLPGNMAS